MLFLLRIVDVTPEERAREVEKIICRYVIAEAQANLKRLNRKQNKI
ncbi:MAG: hypothetical protein LBK68_03570 [Candidatus Margulisbacteria bacterium]|jgi:hypothetical protein|nr:hypothetical protein [Candidatus Margulisiibacteriota bacterium]